MSRDYQSEYNSLYKEYLEYTETVDESIKDQADMNKFYNEYILKYQSKRDYVVDAMNKIASEAKAEGIKIKERPIKYYKNKRSESMDENLELEERAKLETEKDYQKAYDDLADKVVKLQKIAEDKKADAIWLAKVEADNAGDKIYKEYQDKMKPLRKEMANLFNEAKTKGFNLKKSYFDRSEETTDIEERALKTQEDYQKEYDKLKKQLIVVAEHADKESKKCKEKIAKYKEMLNEAEEELDKIFNDYKKDINSVSKELNKLEAEAKSKGFKIKRSEEESTDLETRKKEIVAKLTDLEERKNAVLDNLEERAMPKNEKDAQKVIDKLSNQANKIMKEWYAAKQDWYDAKKNKDDKEVKKLEKEMDSLLKNARDIVSQGRDIQNYFRQHYNIYLKDDFPNL